MNEILKLDSIDKACINALLENPRGSWRELSIASDIPYKKLSRRISKLLDEKIIRVVIELNPLVVNKGLTVHVWLSIKLGKVKEMAQFFSELPEVRVVFLTTGMADIFLEVGLEKTADLHPWMHSFVTQLPDIKTAETQIVLKPFTWASKIKKTSIHSSIVTQHLLSPDELKLIHVLSQDGRISIKSLSEAIQMSEHKTLKTMNELLAKEVFSIRLDFEPSLLDYETEAIILIKARPESIDEIVKALSEIRNTRCLFGISGESQFFWHVLCDDLADLWYLTTEKLSQLSGIQSCNTNMITNAYKRAGYMRKGTQTHIL
ncbi:Lrp/AsnC family transcriptional regulator [Psychrobacter sp. S1-30-MNA-CIBAN-0213]|uniref:Lrp/AsnC family transcriptional regulator n=1 Tax=Psychrobacter sp. S1-30-MNA-CIBAN-0213 TaxID=3140456 RepID=UPI00333322A2